MHASPPFQMIVRRFGVWRFASTLLVCAAAVASTAWALHAMAFYAIAVGCAVALLILASTAILVQAWGLRPTSLRWDTQRWHVGPASSAGHEPASGRIMLALDLGGWMLLRFVPEASPFLHRRGAWLPVQRRGHEAAWPALRSTVYCARPVSLPTVAPF